jgi:hypothetical protein
MEWNELSIGQYQQIVATQEGGLDDLVKMIEVVRIIENLNVKDVHDLSLRQVSDLFNSYTFLNELPEAVVSNFTLFNKRYHVCLDVSKIKASQFIDLKEFTKNPNDLNGKLHLVLAVLSLPKGEEYNGAKVMERAELFRQYLNCEVALPIMVFFWTVFANFTIYIADSLESENKAKKAT